MSTRDEVRATIEALAADVRLRRELLPNADLQLNLGVVRRDVFDLLCEMGATAKVSLHRFRAGEAVVAIDGATLTIGALCIRCQLPDRTPTPDELWSLDVYVGVKWEPHPSDQARVTAGIVTAPPPEAP